MGCQLINGAIKEIQKTNKNIITTLYFACLFSYFSKWMRERETTSSWEKNKLMTNFNYYLGVDYAHFEDMWNAQQQWKK